MRTYLLHLWDTIRTSYWFVPSLFAISAIVLATVLPLLDEHFVSSERELPEWVLTTTDTARTTLSAMAGAMIAVTGTVFSITIVTLSLTSQQFGPRLLRRFMYDLATQLTLGLFLSTGFYCLLILRVVESKEDGLIAPHISVLAAVGFAVLSMGMLIVFIHHIAMLIQAPNVVAAVADDLDDAIVRLFPEKIGEALSESEEKLEDRPEFKKLAAKDPFIVRSNLIGYVQAIDGKGLIEQAIEKDLIINLRSQPGHFISEGTTLAEVWPAKTRDSEKLDEEELSELLNETFITGVRRTPRQDLNCAVEELVEVAVRSLSPGINDPVTAMNCIDYLGAALSQLAERKLPGAYRCDQEGRLRVIARPLEFSNVIDAAFNQIRQYGRDSVAVIIRLLETLTFVAEHISRDEDRAAVKRHGEMIFQTAESIPQEFDQNDIHERYEALKKALEKKANCAE